MSAFIPVAPDARSLVRRYVAELVDPGVTVATQWTNKAFEGPAYVVISGAGTEIAGGVPGQLQSFDAQITVYARGDFTVAERTSQGIHEGLDALWRAAKWYEIAGRQCWIAAITVNGDPSEQRLDGQPSEVYRYIASYRFTIRSRPTT